jgi:hypothetical protein
LETARADQEHRIRREATDQRADREGAQAQLERTPAPEDVSESGARDDERPEGE